MTGLAGFIVAQACNSKTLTVTDGNEVSVKNLAAIIKENNFSNQVSSQLLKWKQIDNHQETTMQYDIAICADCLFFDDGRPELVSCLINILKPNGMAIVVAPRRSGTLEDFVDLITKESEYFYPAKVNCQYSERIFSRRQELMTCNGANFNEDKDYPIMVTCTRK